MLILFHLAPLARRGRIAPANPGEGDYPIVRTCVDSPSSQPSPRERGEGAQRHRGHSRKLTSSCFRSGERTFSSRMIDASVVRVDQANELRVICLAGPVPPAKIFHFARRANHLYKPRRLAPDKERRIAIVTKRWERDAMAEVGAADEARSLGR